MAGLVAFGLLTGCSGGQENSIEIGPVSKPTGPTSTVMPLAAYVPSAGELRTIRRAEGALINACTATYGLKTDVDGPDYEAMLGPIRRGTRLPLPLKQAEQYGYHPAQASASGKQEEKENTWSAEEAAAEQTKLLAINGPAPARRPSGSPSAAPAERPEINGMPVPEGGCLRQAEEELADGAPDLDAHGAKGRSALNVVLFLRHQVELRSAAHPVYRKMTAEWSACMKKEGFPYPTFASAENDPAWQRAPQAGDREIAVATADVRCRLAVNYLGVAESVHIAYEKRAVADSEGLLKAVETEYRTKLRNAAKTA